MADKTYRTIEEVMAAHAAGKLTMGEAYALNRKLAQEIEEREKSTGRGSRVYPGNGRAPHGAPIIIEAIFRQMTKPTTARGLAKDMGVPETVAIYWLTELRKVREALGDLDPEETKFSKKRRRRPATDALLVGRLLGEGETPAKISRFTGRAYSTVVNWASKLESEYDEWMDWVDGDHE